MTGALVWVILLLALSGLAALVVRRMTVLAARTRELERFQRGVAAIDVRLAATVAPLVARLDELRRLTGDPEALASDTAPALETLEALAAEARSLRPPAPLAGRLVAMVAELDRAARAADLVDHGLGTLMSGHGFVGPEALTSLKRGALNLRHSRDAVAGIVAEISRLSPADLHAMPAGAGLEAPPEPYAIRWTEAPDEAADGASEHRM